MNEAGLSPGGGVASSPRGATPIILPSPQSSGNTGLFVQEAGPGAGGGLAGAAAALLTGLQDECVDVADTFITGDGTVAGRLVSGKQPSGRICGTTSFTYTMRYGPFKDCAPRKSVNAATFQAADTRTRGSSQADVAVRVEGCPNPQSVLKVLPAAVTTSALGGYTWGVTKTADRDNLALGQDAMAHVTYTVAYRRSGAKAGATVTADVAVSNPSGAAITLEGATYTATTMCDGAGKTTSGPVTCDGSVVPGGGKVLCKLAATVPCAGYGAYTVVLTAGGGFTVTSAPTAYSFDAAKLAAASYSSECADVKDAFSSGEGRVVGKVVDGKRPNGKLCGSRTFTYTVQFGPFTKCGAFKAINAAAFVANSSTRNGYAMHTLPVNVIGCSAYSEMARSADCVQPASYWLRCNDRDDLKCASGWRMLPGGMAKATLFFPAVNTAAPRTYGSVLGLFAPATLPAAKRAYADAAREHAAAQLNFLSGARLPSAELQDAYDGLGRMLGATREGAALSMDASEEARAAAGLLARYNSGSLPLSHAAPRRCAS
ncbi:MAG: hypothetical protein J3K34DRAFT_425097 [Monoraphidium minutum]|nr:MAG: hypothetical protein J3K34DRAFT_425097 [Monoraphidium minutum]